MLSELPIVSAIMPTRGRHGWAADAVRMFHEQTYPNKELVIIDDAAEPSFIHPPSGAIYQRAPRVTIGAKRNIAVSASGGPVICHWDSDDKYAKDRIESQVGQLLESGADLIGYNRMQFEESDGQFRRFIYEGAPDYCIGVSLMYWREFWEAKPFSDQNEGEDSSFAVGPNCRAFDGSDGKIVARIHWGNTSDKRKWFHLTNQWRQLP
jgi:glycosyltransferase involved in cell wall biosynthesis